MEDVERLGGGGFVYRGTTGRVLDFQYLQCLMRLQFSQKSIGDALVIRCCEDVEDGVPVAVNLEQVDVVSVITIIPADCFWRVVRVSHKLEEFFLFCGRHQKGSHLFFSFYFSFYLCFCSFDFFFFIFLFGQESARLRGCRWKWRGR